MTTVVLSSLFGTIFADVMFSEEWIRVANTFLNFLTIALLVFRERHIRKDLQPKVDEVVEKVKHVEDVVERRKLNAPTPYRRRSD